MSAADPGFEAAMMGSRCADRESASCNARPNPVQTGHEGSALLLDESISVVCDRLNLPPAPSRHCRPFNLGPLLCRHLLRVSAPAAAAASAKPAGPVCNSASASLDVTGERQAEECAWQAETG